MNQIGKNLLGDLPEGKILQVLIGLHWTAVVVDILCGSIVTATGPVLRTAGEGGTFRQIHRAGVRTVTMTHLGIE